MAYFGIFDPRADGIEFSLPPLGPVPREKPNGRGKQARPPPNPAANLGPLPGWYAVSVTMLHGYTYAIHDGKGGKLFTDRPYFTYFQRFEPVARAGYSIYIYHLQPADVDRVRGELGLPVLANGGAHGNGG